MSPTGQREPEEAGVEHGTCGFSRVRTGLGDTRLKPAYTAQIGLDGHAAKNAGAANEEAVK